MSKNEALKEEIFTDEQEVPSRQTAELVSDKGTAAIREFPSVRSGKTQPLPVLSLEEANATLARKKSEEPVKPNPDEVHPLNDIFRGEPIEDPISVSGHVPLTNETFEKLFSQETEEEAVPSRPAIEVPAFVKPLPETLRSPEVPPRRTIQKQRWSNRRRIAAAVGAGVVLGLAGIAAIDHYYPSITHPDTAHSDK